MCVAVCCSVWQFSVHTALQQTATHMIGRWWYWLAHWRHSRHCNTNECSWCLLNGALQHTLNTVTCCNTHNMYLMSIDQRNTTHCNTLQHTWYAADVSWLHCSALQHTATHCNTLQHTAWLVRLKKGLFRSRTGLLGFFWSAIRALLTEHKVLGFYETHLFDFNPLCCTEYTKTPIVYLKSHVVHRKRLLVYQKKTTFYQKRPIFHQKRPMFHQKRLISHQESPIVHQKSPIVYQKRPVVNQETHFPSKETCLL